MSHCKLACSSMMRRLRSDKFEVWDEYEDDPLDVMMALYGRIFETKEPYDRYVEENGGDWVL